MFFGQENGKVVFQVASEEEQVELKSLNEAKDYTTLSAKLKELGERLPIEKKEKVQLWSVSQVFFLSNFTTYFLENLSFPLGCRGFAFETSP